MNPTRDFDGSRLSAPEGAQYPRLLEMLAAGPVDLEIGAGAGWHAIRRAQAKPERGLVALERTRSKFAAFQGRLERHPPLPQLLALNADVVPWLACAPAEIRFARVLLLYPNPEPGNPAARWLRMPFFGRLLSHVESGGEIELRTNVSDYATEAWTRANDWRLVPVERTQWSNKTQPNYRPQTHFERKYFMEGQNLHRLIWRKSDTL